VGGVGSQQLRGSCIKQLSASAEGSAPWRLPAPCGAPALCCRALTAARQLVGPQQPTRVLTSAPAALSSSVQRS
jgi:hypothetical protein